MVSYFYNANYDTSKYDASESLLHTQVAIIADKYDCASLYRLAKTSFANAIEAVKGDDWAAVAPLIYDYTTTDLQAHKELRGLVVAAVTNNTTLSKSIFQMKSIEELLRSNADLATDLLLSEQQRLRDKEDSTHMFTCDNCGYAHAGARECSYLACSRALGHGNVCPHCRKEAGETSKRYTHKVSIFKAIPCTSCGGSHGGY